MLIESATKISARYPALYFRAIQRLRTSAEFSFYHHPGNYSKVVVSWGWTGRAKEEAEKHSIQLWDFRDLLSEIAASSKRKRVYFTDDTLRTLQLFARSMEHH